MSTHFSDKYPPKNRQKTSVDSVIEVEIVWAEGSRRMDMNDLAVAAQTESLKLGTPCRPSDISGKAGYIYRSDDLEVALTRDEMYRYLRHNLEPQEFFALAVKYGISFETHDDFYDEETGRAVQPWYGPRDAQTFFQKCLRGEEDPESIDDVVAQWHEGPETDEPLHRFLGMTWDEYNVWATQPSQLYKLLFERLRDFGHA